MEKMMIFKVLSTYRDVWQWGWELVYHVSQNHQSLADTCGPRSCHHSHDSRDEPAAFPQSRKGPVLHDQQWLVSLLQWQQV